MSANASDSDGSVTKVEFFRGATSLGVDTSAPYAVTWSNAATGSYSLTAVATDNQGATTTSGAIAVTVQAAQSDTTPPSVPTGLASPSQTNTTISLGWNASTDNVGVTGYDVYRGGSSIATVPGTSYTAGGLSPSTAYTFQVRARDGAGNTSALGSPLTVSTKANPPPGGKRVLGYFAQWGIYARNYRVKNIDTSGSAAKVTHDLVIPR